jgi:nitroimidazol reductase NimA-like FMN-containing flavoprotein (pyridoxamine 5'-phosphate oxidase superfamily)
MGRAPSSAALRERPGPRRWLVVIQDLSRDECLAFLANSRSARLACVHEDQPYIVPVFLAYDSLTPGGPSLYGFTTRGAKVDWMRENPKVCVEADEILDFDEWVSVVVVGRYEELSDVPLEEPIEPRDEMTVPRDEMTAPPDDVDLPPSFEHLRAFRRHQGEAGGEQNTERLRAYQVLQSQAMWWEPAWSAWASRAGREPGEMLDPVYYRVRMEQITGHRAIPERTAVPPPMSPPRKGWIRTMLGLE